MIPLIHQFNCGSNNIAVGYCLDCGLSFGDIGHTMWNQIFWQEEKPVENKYETKDSGKREEFSTGMKRDVQTDKPRYDLIGSGWALIKRWAELVGRGAIKYGELNFEKAETEEELRRFKSSAMRHMIQWFQNETDEDHAAAVCFNVAGAEMVKEKLRIGITLAEHKRLADMQNSIADIRYDDIRQG